MLCFADNDIAKSLKQAENTKHNSETEQAEMGSNESANKDKEEGIISCN